MPDSFDYSAPRRAPWAVRLENTPLVTYVLCALCILTTLAYWTANPHGPRLWYLLGNWAVVPAFDIWSGNYAPLLGSMFVHANVVHIGFNLMWLYPLGRMIELSIGRWKYLAFVLAAAVAGSCVQLCVAGDTGIGASGVVYALFGLAWAGRGRYPHWSQIASRRNFEVMVVWGIACIVLTAYRVMNIAIANGAHAGGFLFGLGTGYLLVAPRRKWGWTAPMALLVAACAMALTYLPWVGDWTFWKGNQDFSKRQYPDAIAWYRRSMAEGLDDPAPRENIASAWHNIAIDAYRRKDMTAFQHAEAEEQKAEATLPAPATPPTGK